MFSDLIYTGCTDVLSILSEMPSSKTWYNKVNGDSYKELYIQEMQGLNSLSFFASVFGKADEVWGYLMKESESEYKNVKQIKGIFGLEVPNKLNLSIILVLRLVWMGLWYKINDGSTQSDPDDFEKKSIVKVYKIMHTGNYGFPTDRNINVELNKVCLKQKDFHQKRMLPHERSWLHQKGLIR